LKQSQAKTHHCEGKNSEKNFGSEKYEIYTATEPLTVG